MRENPKVGIVVVTFNRLELLKGAVASLRGQTHGNFQIIVVDNGSTDGTPAWLATQADLLTIRQENLGGAGGFFTGMKYVAEHGDFDLCWVMDDDVECRPNALEELVKAYGAAPDAGFVCSRVTWPDGRTMAGNTPTVGGWPNYLDLVTSHAMVMVSHCTFVSMSIPTAVIREMGLPLKEYFIWGDDVEYGLRLSSRHPCYIACRSEVAHLRAFSTSLSFKEEKDPVRLGRYKYMFRNLAYTTHLRKGWKGELKEVCHGLARGLKLLLRLDFRHAAVIFKAYAALATFRPKVQFPLETTEAAAHNDDKG